MTALYLSGPMTGGVTITCAQCGLLALKRIGDVNHAAKKGSPMYCGRTCFFESLKIDPEKKRLERLSRAKAYYVKNREARLAYHKQWRTENPEIFAASLMARRARKRGAKGRFTAAQWRALNDAYGWRCLRCDSPHSLSPLTKDHVVSLKQGGDNYISNIQPLCLACNLWKNARTIDFREIRPDQRRAAEAALAPLRGMRRSSPSQDVRDRIAAALLGFKHGDASRANMSNGVRDSWTRRGARSDSTSGVRGVTWDAESGKWCASTTVNGKKKRIGRFLTIALAATALRLFKEASA